MSYATTIGLDHAATDVRGGGYGNNAWLAKIIGTDPEYKFKRKFCESEKHLSRSGKSGFINFKMQGAGLYEFRYFCTGTTVNNREWSGFIIINEDGTTEEITRERALEIAATLDK